MTIGLEATLRSLSPRYTRPATPWPSLLIHGAVALTWLLLFAHAFHGHGVGAWSVGIIYIAYDTVLLAFTFAQTWPLRGGQTLPLRGGQTLPLRGGQTLPLRGGQTLPLRHAIIPPGGNDRRPTLTVIVAAYNEEAVLESTITALGLQSEPPEQIIIADDGSTDGTASILTGRYGFAQPELGGISEASAVVPALRWLRAPHAGKARTLNAALAHITTEIMLTVDADTALDADAIQAMRDGFAASPGLVAATGVLAPACDGSLAGRFFEWFQTYEYVRNFLGRYAWAQTDSLLLISGAFAGFRSAAVIEVGGFDPDCMVEDYELIHRLRRYGYDNNLGWHSTVLGQARARTSAPATVRGFLNQRRRWFGGFLQTQLWYRDMVGSRRYHRLGLMMLPVKAVDTFQPIYGLCAFAFLLWYIITGRLALLLPVGGLIFAKIIIDLAFHIWSIRLYRNWVGGHTKAQFGLAVLASIAEPFSFQLLRHLGATLGWWSFLTGKRQWGTSKRAVMAP